MRPSCAQELIILSKNEKKIGIALKNEFESSFQPMMRNRSQIRPFYRNMPYNPLTISKVICLLDFRFDTSNPMIYIRAQRNSTSIRHFNGSHLKYIISWRYQSNAIKKRLILISILTSIKNLAF